MRSDRCADTITLLKCARGKCAAKIWTWVDDPPGWVCDGYDAGWKFDGKEVVVDGIDRLHEVLSWLHTQTQWLVVRGSLAHATNGVAYRLVRRYRGPRADVGLLSRPRRWVCLDIETDAIKPNMGTVDGEAATHLQVLNWLGPPWNQTTHHWYWSSSAGFDHKTRCHLWYWLDVPLDDPTWRHVWSKLYPSKSDPRLYNPAQPHYEAAPVIDGPNPVALRCGLWRGSYDVVRVPDWLADLPRTLEREDAHRRRAARRKAESWRQRFRDRGGDQTRAERYVQRVIETAEEKIAAAGKGGRHDTIRNVALTTLGYCHGLGVLRDEAWARIQQAADALAPNRAAEWTRLLRWSDEEAAKKPLTPKTSAA